MGGQSGRNGEELEKGRKAGRGAGMKVNQVFQDPLCDLCIHWGPKGGRHKAGGEKAAPLLRKDKENPSQRIPDARLSFSTLPDLQFVIGLSSLHRLTPTPSHSPWQDESGR